QREHRLVEEREGRSDLVERARRNGTKSGSSPQERDLLTQAAPQIAVLVGGELRVVDAFQQAVAAPEGDEERPPSGFGRVGRENRLDSKPADEPHDLTA